MISVAQHNIINTGGDLSGQSRALNGGVDGKNFDANRIFPDGKNVLPIRRNYEFTTNRSRSHNFGSTEMQLI